MPTAIPSVSTFSAPPALAPGDAERSSTKTVHYWLGRDIVRGVFAPLERLKIEQLVAFYKVGHSPVREAILLLSTSGLVVHEPQKGHRVAPVSLADYRDLIGVYRRIYRLTLEMALENGDDAWEEAVIVQLHRSLKIGKHFDDPEQRERWQRSFANLHYRLLSGCGSPLLLRMWSDLGNRLERYVNLFADLEVDRPRDHHAEHRAIVDALVHRNAPRLEGLIRSYFELGAAFHDTIDAALTAQETANDRTPTPRRRGRPRKLPASAT